ncbi:MAG: glutamate--tRNA ligase [bacterium]|nr:glutamate--tRNA ligase [bacterium]
MIVTENIRVRFCPSPTGNPHVGMVRTALFNWAYARHTGGTFVFRIEDTDSARDSEESYDSLLGALRWLGLDWDEGPEVGGQYGPYRQSERMEIYGDVAARLRSGGYAYDCYCSTAELDERRERAMAEKRPPGYDGHCRSLTDEQISAYRAEGRVPVLRLRMPDSDSTWDDLVRGPITFAADQVPDYVLVRANGDPVDDALMRITHVLRGEDLLSSTPRQLALYAALAEIGVSDGSTPRFGHLPYVMGEGNKKLSKRDPESSLQWYRDEGYLPEALLNYLALLGWSMGEDREFFSKDEMAGAFTLDRVSPNPARFDLKKCTAINGDWIRTLTPADLATRIIPFLARAGVVGNTPTDSQLAVLAAGVPLIQERMDTLSQSVGMLGFLLVSEADFTRDEADVAAMLTAESIPVLDASITALDDLGDWNAEAIEATLREALIEGLGLKPKVAFAPLRVAVSGRRISPPLFESLEILGRDSTLARLGGAREEAV